MSTEETAPPLAAEAAETPAPEASPAEPASSEAASAVDAAAEALEKVGVAEPADPDAPDAPDLALKSEVLVEQEETVVEKKVVDNTPYASAKSFEELAYPRSPAGPVQRDEVRTPVEDPGRPRR